MPDPLEVRFALTRSEFAAAARAGNDRLIRFGAVAGAAVLGVGIAARLSALTAAGVIVVLAAVGAWVLPWLRWFAEPSLRDEERWVIDDDGCTIERSGSTSRNSWAYYREAFAAGPVYALMTIRSSVDAVPKRALTAGADAAFVALVAAHVNVRESAAPSSGWTD